MLLDGVYALANIRRRPFILVEGMNGAGKTSVVKYVSERLRAYRDVLSTSEPTAQSSFGRLIRAIVDNSYVDRALLGEAKGDLERTNERLYAEISLILNFLKRGRGNLSEAERQKLFVMDRLSHINEGVLPNLLQGRVVIQDRYDVSSYCHGMANGYSFKRNWEFHRKALGDSYLAPDVIFYLWIPVPLAVERLNRSGKIIDLYEGEITLRRVEDAARSILGFRDDLPGCGQFLQREFSVLGKRHFIFIVNAEPSVEEVSELTLKLLATFVR